MGLFQLIQGHILSPELDDTHAIFLDHESFTKIMRLTTNFTGKVAFLMYTEMDKC